MKITIRANCFPGFYGTWFGAEMACERSAEYLQSDYPWHEWEYLDDWNVSDNYYDNIAKSYAETYISQINDTLELNLEIVKTSVWTPREYNFSTDQIDIEVEVGDYDEFVNKLVKIMNDPDNRVALAKIIKARHTSCSGFWSFMSNDTEEWYGLIQDPDNELYVSCLLWYLTILNQDEDCLEETISVITMECCSSQGLDCDVVPETENAQIEWDEVQKEAARRDFVENYPRIPGL